MSTVAARRYDYGGGHLRIVFAADKRMSWHNSTVVKLWTLGEASDFILAGGAGTYTSVLQAVKWLDEGGDPNNKPELDDKDFHLLLVDGEGTLWLAADSLELMSIANDSHSIGSGSPYAMGAMHAGATPLRAVEAAAVFDGATGNGLDELYFDIHIGDGHE